MQSRALRAIVLVALLAAAAILFVALRDGENRERDDQDHRRPPREQPLGDRQVLARRECVGERRHQRGSTVSSAILVWAPSSSTSNPPSMSAGKSNLATFPGPTSSIAS